MTEKKSNVPNLCRPVTWTRFQRKLWLTAAGRSCQENTATMVSMRYGALCASGSKPCGCSGEKILLLLLFPQMSLRRLQHQILLLWTIKQGLSLFSTELNLLLLGLFGPALEYPVEKTQKHVDLLFLVVALDLILLGLFLLHNSLCSKGQGTDPLQFNVSFTLSSEDDEDSSGGDLVSLSDNLKHYLNAAEIFAAENNTRPTTWSTINSNLLAHTTVRLSSPSALVSGHIQVYGKKKKIAKVNDKSLSGFVLWWHLWFVAIITS